MNVRYWTEEEIHKAKELYKQGNNYSDIGRILERNSGSVRGKLISLGIANSGKKRSKEYKYKIGECVNSSLKIMKQTRKNGSRAYIVQSLIYPDAPSYTITEYHLKEGSKCAYLSNQRVFEGNSLWGEIKYRKYIVNVEEAKTIAPHSNKKIRFKCPDCNREKYMTPSKLLEYGIACPFCSKGISFSELFFQAYLEVKNINYRSQVMFNNSLHRIDFKISLNSQTIFVETHGIQHFDRRSEWYETTKESDIIKRKWCKENNYELIELDCRKSSFKYITNSINECSTLPNIDGNELLQIQKIVRSNKRYPVSKIKDMYISKKMSTCDIGKELGLSPITIRDILRKNNINIRSSVEQRRGLILDEKIVVEDYKSDTLTVQEIKDKYNISYNTLRNLLKKNDIECKKHKKMVRCVDTGKIYESGYAAMKETGISNKYISEVCRGKQRMAGGYKWEFVNNK